ncbi:MAG: UDP-N-acetylenolpyruvoylglucosamine reductase [Parcubacteria bacterium C7867-001]|nr:MAG: UDP-N-acetylenolpyruvoylglucosamine reductase [Parcubacteria bacterium C7867-001]
MIVREHVPLRSLTTFKVGGEARYVIECSTEEDAHTALAFIRERSVPFYVLGEGSNVLASDEGYEGAIIHMQAQQRSDREDSEFVYLTAGAGYSWDTLVDEACARGLWGMENLAGIPGTVGAAPVQNIGAYGAELVHIFDCARVLHVETGIVEVFRTEDCAFGYRDSRFKHDSSFIILEVTLKLSKSGAPSLSYPDLLRAQEESVDLSTPAAIAAAVRAIRSRKFPDLSLVGTAGSFFKNPVVSEEEYAALVEKYGLIPSFPSTQGVKIPLAYILDKILGLKGFRNGNVFLFENQPLVVVAENNASANDIDAFANEIASRVYDATNIRIEREVRKLSS